ncbi:MAG: helix-turn-helix transcriptional regulator [Alphaproteobacteria bacterium]|nr:helix-turn-helix transcriptional regulator [Alphaproteobacteria bacterium]
MARASRNAAARTAEKPLRLRGRRGRASPGPNPIDIHVGKRLRERRTLLGMSQQELGRLIGITFQQLQKNERGTNRLSASRIFECARVLDVPVSYFFEEMPSDVSSFGRKHLQGVAEGPTPAFDLDPMAKRETLELVRAYYDLTDRQVRMNMVTMMRTLAKNDPDSRVHDRPRRGRPPKR